MRETHTERKLMDKIKKAFKAVGNEIINHRASIVGAGAIGAIVFVMADAGGEFAKYDQFLADKDLLSEFHKYRHPAKD